MDTRNQANIEQNLDDTTLDRPSLFRRAVAWITIVAYIGQPLAVTAEVIADQAAAANNRPMVDATANGLPLVQITSPNAAGLSHNQYTQFNVGPEGVMLNNSQAIVQTQQAGFVAANPNLMTGTARIILNEVTGASNSQLNGYTEVAGPKAEVIIANPNGITCNGCGFINTSRGVLTTGTPVIGSGGSLDAFRVTGGDIQIGSAGLNGSNLNQLDLIARSVQVNGEIWANNLNVITGTNQVNHDLQGMTVITGIANQPVIGIDVALLGGMYANKIYLVGTEAGVGVRSFGNLAAMAGDFTLDNAGQITLLGGNTTAKGNVTINSNTDITNTGSLLAGGNLSLTSAGDLINTGGQIGSGQDLAITANTIAGNGQVVAGRDAIINLQGNYTNAAGNVLKANRDLSITTSGNFINQTTLESVGTLAVNAANIDNQTSASLNANLTRLSTAGDITNAGAIDGNTVETNSVSFLNTGSVMADVININANNLNNLNAAAFIGATNSVNLNIAGLLNNQDGANIFSLGDINIGSNLIINPATGAVDPATTYLTGNTGSVTNQSATIEAGGNLRISADSITNTRTNYALEWGPTWNGPVVVDTSVPRVTKTYTPTYADEQFNAAVTTPAAQLLSGNDMWINLGSGGLTNTYSDIIAGGAINIPSAQLPSVVNDGPAFRRREHDVGTTVTNTWMVVGQHCGGVMFLGSCIGGWVDDWGWRDVTTPINTTSIQPIPNAGDNYSYLENTQPPGTSSTITRQNVVAGAGLTVPASGLYTIHDQPGQPYLVVTDLRFAHYGNFISSDYMLSRMAYDPEFVQKRLGDGFYEQKLVSDQVTAATGRRFLAGYDEAQEQFIALLNSGVDAAEEFNLALGVALTATQINALKHDIVWMVERDVTLANGTTERVLAPQVYLANVQPADLKPSGALIAANAININLAPSETTALDVGNAGMFSNSGTIRADTSLSINANDIKNQGGTISSGGSAKLVASNDILNLSGKISGDTVNLTAGRDIRNETTSQEVTHTINGGAQTGTAFGFAKPVSQISATGTVKDTELGLTAGISAKHSLSMKAGQDISIVGATVNAGDEATLNAGRDLTVGVLTATNTSTANQYAAYLNTVTQHASSIQTGDNLTLISGNDMHLTSAALDVGKDATLVAGGDLTLDASKNSTASGYNAGSAIGRFYDETVLGSSINAGGNATLVATQLNAEAATNSHDSNNDDSGTAGRTDEKGNITLNSTAITSKAGKVAVAADANVDIGVTEEQHTTYSELHSKSSGLTTTTYRTTRNETWRTDTIGSSLSGDSVSITSGKDVNITGSDVSAEHDINVAAMNNVNISASTDTFGSDYYHHEITNGWQAKDGFNITNHGPETTTKVRTDGTNQSQNRSSLSSNNGNLSILAGGNLIALGTDFAAGRSPETAPERPRWGEEDGMMHAYETIQAGLPVGGVAKLDHTKGAPQGGQITLNASGTIALFAGQDTYNQSSSSKTVTQDNIITKQRHTITDTYASLYYQGSTLKGKSIEISSGADTLLQATDVNAGAGGINIDAAGDLQLLTAANVVSTTHTETLATDGFLFRADGSLNDTDTRRMNNKRETQVVTNQVTSLVSGGDITTHSGGDTRIEASRLDAQGAIDLSATGYEAAYNEDGSLKYEGRDGTITFAAVKDSNYYNEENSSNSMPWQSTNGQGEVAETIKLANISTGKGLTVDAKGGIIVDIPEVPAEAPAPVEPEEPIPTKGPDGKPLTAEEKAALIAERAAKKAAGAIQAEAARKARAEQRFNDHIQTLASQPGQEWIGQLAQQAKEQPDSVKLQQVNAALEKWDYRHDGLTPTATAVIAIVVTYFTAGTGSSAVGAATGTSATTAASTYVVATAVTQAAITTLATQATLSLINNKGNIGKTLDDLGKSENVKALVTAMVTAGVLSGLSQNLNIGKTSMANVNAKSPFIDQLQKNVINNTASTVVNHALNGGDFRLQLEQSLRNAFIDTGAAQSANWIGDMKQKNNFNDFTHKLAHAIAGCAVGEAKAGDCGSGALGAVVGELSAEWYGGTRENNSLDQPGFQTDTVNFAKMMAGIAVAITGGDAEAVNLAASTGGNAAENNFLGHLAQSERDKLREKAKHEDLTKEESATLAKLELADQLGDELLNKYRSGATLTEDDKYNLSFYLWAYSQQEGNQATADLVRNGPTPTYDFPYASSTANQIAKMDTLREQNGGGILAYLTTSRPESENQELFFTAMRDSDMGGSMFGGVNPNESYLPSANKYDFSTLDALINSPVLGTSAYMAGNAMGADQSSVDAATRFMSNLSDALSAPVIPRIGLGQAYGSTSASASAASVEAYLGLRNPSGSTINSANAARNQYYGYGESASPSPGTNTARSSGAGSGKIFLGEYTFDAMRPGPLPDRVASTFAGGRYSQGVVSSTNEMFYKGGDAANPGGSFFNFYAPEGIAQVRIDNAVRPQWINPVTGALEAESPINSAIGAQFPIGTTYYYGPVSSQGGVYLGGNNKIQVYVPDARKTGTFTPLGKIE